MPILAAERQQQILERIGREGRVLAAALAEVFATSEDTIRRDLRDLAGRGLCRRVYGGALPVSPASNPVQVRIGEATDRKAALGRALAALVAPGSFIFIDSGSTNLAAAKAFPEGLQATAATHDPAIAAVLSAKSEVTVWLIGGRVSPQIGAATRRPGFGRRRGVAPRSCSPRRLRARSGRGNCRVRSGGRRDQTGNSLRNFLVA